MDEIEVEEQQQQQQQQQQQEEPAATTTSASNNIEIDETNNTESNDNNVTTTTTPNANDGAKENEEDDVKKSKLLFLIKIYIIEYFKKWKGGEKSPARADLEEIGWSWLSSFIGILVLALIHYRAAIETNMIVLLGSFAASAVLIFGAPKSPLAQPRNLVLGHFVSATVGSIVRVALVYTNAQVEVACALAVSLAIVGMHFTKSIHPPGGATALICVMNPEQRWRGFYYIFVPVLSGSLIMLLTALIVNNFARKRKYPVFWY